MAATAKGSWLDRPALSKRVMKISSHRPTTPRPSTAAKWQPRRFPCAGEAAVDTHDDGGDGFRRDGRRLTVNHLGD